MTDTHTKLTEETEAGEYSVSMERGYFIIETPWTDKPVKLSDTSVDTLAEKVGEETEYSTYINSPSISEALDD